MTLFAGHRQAMLTEIYIEALLVDEELADQVWEAWDAGVITDDLAALAWFILAFGPASIIWPDHRQYGSSVI